MYWLPTGCLHMSVHAIHGGAVRVISDSSEGIYHADATYTDGMHGRF